jgi:hypothetical protein
MGCPGGALPPGRLPRLPATVRLPMLKIESLHVKEGAAAGIVGRGAGARKASGRSAETKESSMAGSRRPMPSPFPLHAPGLPRLKRFSKCNPAHPCLSWSFSASFPNFWKSSCNLAASARPPSSSPFRSAQRRTLRWACCSVKKSSNAASGGRRHVPSLYKQERRRLSSSCTREATAVEMAAASSEQLSGAGGTM